MKSILNVIEHCDSFGVLLQLRLKNNEPKFRTLYGGFLTLAIYSIASVYFVYLIFIWQSKLIPPTVTIQTRTQEDGQYLHVSHPIFYMNVIIDRPTEEIRRIEQTTHLFDVTGVYQGKNYLIEPMKPNGPDDNCGMKKIEIDFFHPICPNLKDDKQTWLYQSASRADDVFWEYYVNFCDPSKDPTCTNEAQRKKMMDAIAYWQLITVTQDIDLTTGQIYQIPSYNYYEMDRQFKKGFQLQLKVTKAEVRIDDGFLLPRYTYIDMVKDVKIGFDQNSDQQNLGPLILVSLEKSYYKIEIQYAKFGDVLASFNSLLQGLLLCGIIMTSFNKNSFIKQSEDYLMSMYFPELKNYKLITNWRGQVTSVLKNGIEIDSQSKNIFLKTIKHLRSKMSLKFNHLNLLHEINKLQLALYTMRSKEHIQKIQQWSYTLLPSVNPTSPMASPIEHCQDLEPLSEQDFLIYLSSVDIETFDGKVDQLNSVVGIAAKIEQRIYSESDAALIQKKVPSERGISHKIQSSNPSSIARIQE